MAFISDTQLNIRDVVIDGNWDFSLVRTSIPPQFLDVINQCNPQFHSLDQYCWVWNASSSGAYSAASGYNWLLERKGLRRAYWSPPPLDVIKGNVDGSFFPDSKRMGVGGLFRDNNKQWLGGFSGYVGCGNPLEAELLAVLSALQFAWSQGWKSLILETDSMEVLTLWSFGAVEFTHVYQEGNQPADLLACQGALSVHHGFWLDDPPIEVSTLILKDAVSCF
ncbi:Ribonuclease H-like superfamily [Sesbania bispinosa]|nr:Ribonuclease H-like superfamily [Sesbania bispinosa]